LLDLPPAAQCGCARRGSLPRRASWVGPGAGCDPDRRCRSSKVVG
jgi:hypothetical protein